MMRIEGIKESEWGIKDAYQIRLDLAAWKPSARAKLARRWAGCTFDTQSFVVQPLFGPHRHTSQ